MSDRPIGFDIETASAKELFTYGDGFLRLAAYTNPAGGEPITTTDMTELIEQLEDAPWIYGHNVMGFDLLALAFYHGADWETLAMKCRDSLILERLRYPPKARDAGGSEDSYDLETVLARHDLEGKTDVIANLGREFGGYDLIPVDDERYRSYVRGDVDGIDRLIGELPEDRYSTREHNVQSWLGRMTLNGMRVDTELNDMRIAEGEERKRNAMHALGSDWELPLGRFNWTGRGKDKIETWEDFDAPFNTLEGRKWMMSMWDAFGVANPPRTDGNRLSTKAEHLRAILAQPGLNPEMVEVLNLIMTVTTVRTVYQTTDDCLINGFVHAGINMGQSSGRSSVTNPGLTVFGKRNGRYIERDIFIPDQDDWSIFTSDLKQVDMRGIAGLCQDANYMRLFENGRDPHAEIAKELFGSVEFRDLVKPITHGSNYGLGQKKLIDQGHDPDKVRHYFAQRKKQFGVLMEWQDEMRDLARSGYLTGSHGKLMRPDVSRVYTQAPALMGQNAAAEILKDCILRLPEEFRPYVKTMVHDEIVFACPTKIVQEVMEEVRHAMTFEFRGVPIECDISGPGPSWGAVCAMH